MNISSYTGDANFPFTVSLDEREEVDVPLTFFRLFVFIVGILGNLFMIFVILIVAEYKKNVTHWYVLNLAIANSLFLLTLPMLVADHLQSKRSKLEWMCKLKDTIMFLNYYSSVCFLVVMSIDRYIAVCHWRPTSLVQKLRTPMAVGIITICVWIVCLLMCVPVMLYSTTKGVQPKCECEFVFPQTFDVEELCQKESGGDLESYKYCMEHATTRSDQGHCIEEEDFPFYSSNISGFDFNYTDLFVTDFTTTSLPAYEVELPVTVLNPECHYFQYSQGFLAFLWFNFIGMFIVPLIIMSVFYALIVVRSNVNLETTDLNRSNTYVTAMCATMVVVFATCWLPFHVVHLLKMKGIQRTTEFCQKLSEVVILVAFANSMLNPFAYNFVGTRFFNRLRIVSSTIRSCCNKRTSSSGTTIQVHYDKRTNDGGASNSQTGTVTTKISTENAEVNSGAELPSKTLTDDSRPNEE